MPGNLKKKYTPEQLREAVHKVHAGEMGLRQAAKAYNIPAMTLSDNVHGKNKGSKSGAPPVLTPEMEAVFAQTLITLADKGFGLTRQLVKVKVADFCRKAGIDHPFKEGSAGQTWYRNFRKRHPELSLRTPSKLCTLRGRAMDQKIIMDYFQDVAKVTRGIPKQQLWNMNETGFQFEHNPSKIICQKGVRAVNARVSPSRRNVTVLACASAAGSVMPPMLVVKGKTFKSLHGFNPSDAPPHTKFTWQQKAWMDDSLGVEWFREVFLKHCGPERPQVLFLDQHHSHEVLEMLELAKKEGIHMMAFPPHTSHWLQPLDKGCFSSLTKHYRSICSNYMSASRTQVVNKASFAKLFTEAWEMGMTPSNARAGFKVTGISPFNPAAIPERAYATYLALPAELQAEAAPPAELQADAVPPAELQADAVPPAELHADAVPPAELHADAVPPAELHAEAAPPAELQADAVPPAELHADAVPPAELHAEAVPPAEEEQAVRIPDGTTLAAIFLPPEIVQEYTSPDVPEIIDKNSELEQFLKRLETERQEPTPPTPSWAASLDAVLSIEDRSTPSTSRSTHQSKTSGSQPVRKHRILTSDECLALKRQEQSQKEEKEKQKLKRKKMAEEKAKTKKAKEEEKAKETGKGKKKGKGKGKMGMGKMALKNMCILCLSEEEGNWIQCDNCHRWMHQTCVPEVLRENMQDLITNGGEFQCHICMYT